MAKISQEIKNLVSSVNLDDIVRGLHVDLNRQEECYQAKYKDLVIANGESPSHARKKAKGVLHSAFQSVQAQGAPRGLAAIVAAKCGALDSTDAHEHDYDK